jgi:hypothetical protein
MKYQDKIRIFSQKKENQDIFKISGKNQESSAAAKPVYGLSIINDDEEIASLNFEICLL